MTARTNQDLQLHQGDYKLVSVTVFDRLNARVQLNTGTMSFTYEVRENDRAAAYHFRKTLGAGIAIDNDQTGSSRGIFYIEIDPEDTATPSPTDADLEGNLYHEAHITSGGKPNVIFTGEFEVLVSTIQ